MTGVDPSWILSSTPAYCFQWSDGCCAYTFFDGGFLDAIKTAADYFFNNDPQTRLNAQADLPILLWCSPDLMTRLNLALNAHGFWNRSAGYVSTVVTYLGTRTILICSDWHVTSPRSFYSRPCTPDLYTDVWRSHCIRLASEGRP